MAKRISVIIAMLTIFTATGCATAPKSAQSGEYSVITAYVQAYNDRDIPAMSALMHPKIQWLSIEGSKTVIVADGKADLVKQMSEYVSSPSATTSELASPVFNGQFIAVKETARWKRANGSVGQQSALSVYEIDKGLVCRVWYYPSERAAETATKNK